MATAAVLLSAFAAFAAKPAAAESIVLTLNTDFGNNSGSGFPTATFTDSGVDTVDLVMSLTGLSDPNEFVTDWYFNSKVDPSSFVFTYVAGPSSTGPAALTMDLTFNSASDFKADGVGGYHDIVFNFSSAAGSRFNMDEFVKYTITGTGITASTFNVAGIPSGGAAYISAAHLQGTSDASTWLGVGPTITTLTVTPEPATLALLGLGMAGFAARKRLKRGEQNS